MAACAKKSTGANTSSAHQVRHSACQRCLTSNRHSKYVFMINREFFPEDNVEFILQFFVQIVFHARVGSAVELPQHPSSKAAVVQHPVKENHVSAWPKHAAALVQRSLELGVREVVGYGLAYH